VTVPTAVLDKLDAGLLLTDEEQEMVGAVPAVSERLISSIPRLEGLAAAIGQQRLRYDGQSSRPGAPVGDDLPLAARLLHFAVDVDTMRSQRLPALAALDRMRKDAGAYDPRILDVWARGIEGEGVPDVVPVTVEFDELGPGMVLLEDVLSARGVVLLGRGSTVSEALLQRLRNHVKHSGLSGTIVVSSQRRADVDVT
jgi:hypothetical protein